MDDKRKFFSVLEGIKAGSLCVKEPGGGELYFGAPGSGPAARMVIHDNSVFRRVVRGGPLGLGESYVDGLWDIEGGQLVQFFGTIFINHLDERAPSGLPVRLLAFIRRLLDTPSSVGISKRCVSYHYDLSNEFFSQMLDESMTYSCGYCLSSSDSLHDMQMQKYALIASKLGLQEGERVLDIGCGWGGMLLYAAKYHGISGIGITLSSRQAEYAKKLIAAEGLERSLEVRLCDYRQIEGVFDCVVSIGMFEHVGLAQHGVYMDAVKHLLRPGGRGLLHTVGSSDTPGRGADPWISKYIFPGSRLPRLHEITSEIDKKKLLVAHIENLKPHYAETLACWRSNFTKNWPNIRRLKPSYTERFRRMWEYYLQVCEAGFRYGDMQLYQVLFSEGGSWELPMNLDFSAVPQDRHLGNFRLKVIDRNKLSASACLTL